MIERSLLDRLSAELGLSAVLPCWLTIDPDEWLDRLRMRSASSGAVIAAGQLVVDAFSLAQSRAGETAVRQVSSFLPLFSSCTGETGSTASGRDSAHFAVYARTHGSIRSRENPGRHRGPWRPPRRPRDRVLRHRASLRLWPPADRPGAPDMADRRWRRHRRHRPRRTAGGVYARDPPPQVQNLQLVGGKGSTKALPRAPGGESTAAGSVLSVSWQLALQYRKPPKLWCRLGDSNTRPHHYELRDPCRARSCRGGVPFDIT